MTAIRRHPRRIQLEAWFDGEAPAELAWHVIGCERCFRHLDRTARIRAGVRAAIAEQRRADTVSARIALSAVPASRPRHSKVTPTPPPERSTAEGEAKSHSWRRVPVTAAALVAVLGLTAGALAGPLRSTVTPGSHVPGAGSGSGGSALRSGPGLSGGANPSRPGQVVQPGTARANGGSGSTRQSGGRAPTGSGTGSGQSSAGGFGPSSAAAGGHALRLAVVVPTAGPDSAEGAEVQNAAQAAIDEANSTGGVGGRPVQLQVVPAEDSAALAALTGRVDAIVGGFGAAQPGTLPWILPADPAVTGLGVVAAELSPRAAGTQLASDLLARGLTGTVGVVGGSGPDSALAAGIGKVLPTDVIQVAPGASCLSAVSDLQSQGVDALAVAGSSDLASSCLSSAQALSWQPPGGVLVPPSTAYAGLGSAAVTGAVSGVRTVLGLPWPTAAQPGAQRFESTQPGTTSYRALVTFAAVELAVEVSRVSGSPAPTAMTGGTWRNDLFDYTGLTNAGTRIVEAPNGAWVASP